MRNVKGFGLLLILVLSIGSLSANIAAANEFNAEKYPVTLTGSKDGTFQDVLTTTAGTGKCTTPTYAGTASASSTAVALIPTYTGCTYAGFPATATTTGCFFIFNIGAGATTDGDADFECVGGAEFTLTAVSGGVDKCTFHMKSQTDIGGTVKYINIGSGATREITIEANLSGIDYTHTAGTGIGSCTSGSSTTGTWVFKTVVTAESGSHVGYFLTSS